MLIRNARFHTTRGLPLRFTIDEDSGVRITRQQKVYYVRRLNSGTWWDKSHQRIINAALELEEALRAVIIDKVE